MKKYIGIPFKDGEPSCDGANCITLIELFYKNHLDLEIPKIRVKSDNSRRAFMEYLKQISEHWTEVKEPKTFDVVAMARDIKHPKVVQHFAIYIGSGRILHSLENVGSHIDTIENLKPFIKGFYRWQS